MNLKSSGKLPRKGINRILVRGTNWIGDAVLTLSAISAVRSTYPRAAIYVLAKPWVADIFRLCPEVDEIILYDSAGVHRGIQGKWRLARQLKLLDFDMAILLQNAMEAAIIARLAGIPVRAGYNSDARGMLLTHSVKRTAAVRKIHQRDYYVSLVESLGCLPPRSGPFLVLSEGDMEAGERFLRKEGLEARGLIIGIAPGATYGPAKKWLPERFANLADRLKEEYSAPIMLFGSAEDREATGRVREASRHSLIDLAGKIDLRTAIALIDRCGLFISNDSGLMHAAGGLNVPTLAIFGSTNPLTTSPLGSESRILYKGVDCSPCLKKTCPTDFRCMNSITTDEVHRAAREMLCKK